MQNPGLWQRLSNFAFDAGRGSEPYSVKLAAAEGWSPEYTRRVIEEYRRFIYLTRVMGRQATPPVAVDRAWHMHLTFTRSYWEELCGQVLGAMLHHEPCAGPEEMPRYEAQYARTLAAYSAEFGGAPPADIWPAPDARAVQTRQSGPLAAALFLAGTGAVVLSASWLAGGRFALALPGLAVGILACAAGLLVLPKRAGRTGKAGGCGGGCGAGGCGGGGCGGCGGG